ncbi:MAG: WD40 repeat domain-containing protein, partial [Bacteroidota bacterium]
MKRSLIMMFLLLGTFLNVHAFENDLTAICQHPETGELFVGGEFKTIFVLDSETSELKRQFSFDPGVDDMSFSSDGKSLLISRSLKCYLVDPENGKVIKSVKGDFQLFDRGPYAANVDWMGKRIQLFDVNTLKLVAEEAFDMAPGVIGFRPDFKEMAIISRSREIKKEKNLLTEKVEEASGYNIYNDAYVEEQNDKKGADFLIWNLETNAVKQVAVLPYTFNKTFGMCLGWAKDSYYAAHWDKLVRIDKEGRCFPIETNLATFAYCANVGPEGHTILVASAKRGFLFYPEKSTFRSFDQSETGELPYSRDAFFAQDFIYLLSRDFSILKLDYEGNVEKELVIEQASENGFGLYYYNGFRRKEDRDKEAA